MLWTISQQLDSNLESRIKSAIFNGNYEELENLAQFSFEKPHTNSPKHLILKKALEIPDPLELKKWMAAEFAKLETTSAKSTQSLLDCKGLLSTQ